MTIARTIQNARSHLKIGNRYAYAAVMSGAIRAAMSTRTSNAIRKAIAEDKMEHLFVDLATSCPLVNPWLENIN